MNLDPTTTKYLIRARIKADGVIEKPDVVGAVFGQTEGLLGNELDLRDLQKSARIGRIEVDIDSKKGKSEGIIHLPSSLDKVETAILAAALESIDRVGPCKAEIKVERVEDVRVVRRKTIIDRAKVLLNQILEESKGESDLLTEEVRSAVQTAEIVQWGPDRLPAGPNIGRSDAILVVEGRKDVLNLLKCGIKNAIAIEGTSVPKSIQEISKERITTAFVDGDRGGELIMRELLQTCEVDFVARAPPTREVEELPQKLVMKSLKNKIPAEQFAEMYGIAMPKREKEKAPAHLLLKKADAALPAEYHQEGAGFGPAPTEVREAAGEAPRARPEMERPERREPERREPREPREERREDRGPGRGGDRERGGRGDRGGDRDQKPGLFQRLRGGERREAPREAPREERGDREERREAPSPGKKLNPDQEKYKGILDSIAGSLTAVLLDKSGAELKRDIAVRELAETLKTGQNGIGAVVFDGVITQRLLDIAAEKQIPTIVGVKLGNVTKQPTEVTIWTRSDLS